MTSRRTATPPRRALAIRHCPLCGTAMQASKSREDLENFDTYRCLNCHTTIVQAAPAAKSPTKRARTR